LSTRITVLGVTRYIRPPSSITTLACGSRRMMVPASIAWAAATAAIVSESAATKTAIRGRIRYLP
jgi:hypothetical protein